MSSTEPTASTEKPILEPLSTSTEHTDFLSTEVSENPSKTQHGKSIGTTTPEVEGEEQELIATVEDYPTTPVSAVDPKSSSVLQLTETPEPEKEAPLPPSSSLELSPSLNLKEAEEKALPEATPLEAAQLEAHEPKLDVEAPSVEAKDKQLPKENEVNEEPLSSGSEKPLETATATIELSQAGEASEQVGAEDKLLPKPEKSALGEADTPSETNENPLPEITKTSEPEKHIPDSIPSLEPESGASGPTSEGDKPLIEEVSTVEVEDATPKPLPQDSEIVHLGDKSEETTKASTDDLELKGTKEAAVQEEETSAEISSASATTDEIPVLSEPEPQPVVELAETHTEPEVTKETLPETVKEGTEEPQTLLDVDEVPKASETTEVVKEDSVAEKTHGEATPELESAETPKPIPEVETAEAEAVGPNVSSNELTPEVEEASTTEEIVPSGQTGTIKDTPEPTSAEETSGGEVLAVEDSSATEKAPKIENPLASKEDSAPKTEEVAAVIPEASAEEETPLAKEVSEVEGISESKSEAITEPIVSEPTASDESITLDESPAAKETVATSETPVTNEASEAVPEVELTVAEAEAANKTPALEEESTVAEPSTTEEPLVIQDKPTIDQESVLDDLVVGAVSIEEASAVEDELKKIEPKEEATSSSELKEAVVAEPVFEVLDGTREAVIEEPQTEKAIAAAEQDLDNSAPVPITEDVTPEVKPKEDKHSEESKELENLEAVQKLPGEAPLKDLEAMAEPSTEKEIAEELPIIEQAPESNPTVEESSSAKGEAEEIKGEPPLEDLATVAIVSEDSPESQEISQSVEAQAVEGEPVTKDVSIGEQAVLEEAPGVEQNEEPVNEVVTTEEVAPLSTFETQEEVQEEVQKVPEPVEESEVKSVEPENATEDVAPAVTVKEEPKVQEEGSPAEATADNQDETPEVPVEVPEIVVELTAKNQPSHGDDLGPEATPGQQDAFEKRKADAEPDTIIVVEEPSTPEFTPVDMTAAEPALPEQESTDKGHETKAEQTPATEVLAEETPVAEDTPTIKETSADETPAAEEASAKEDPVVEEIPATRDIPTEETPAVGETLVVEETSNVEEDDAIIISHDDAKPEDVAEAEAAVKIPDPVDITSEDTTTTEVTEPLPLSKEPKEEEEETHRTPTPAPVEAAFIEEILDHPSQEVSINPLPASETFGNPIDLAPGEKVPDFGASSIDANVKLDPESYEKADASNFGVKHDAASEEIFSVNPLPAFETAVNPINLQPGEPIPDIGSASIGSAVKLDEESYEKADASNLGVKSEATATTEPQEFSVKPLPASETAGNPIELQPGEPIPQIGSSSIESNVKLDQESYEKADASNLGVKPEAGPEEFSINPLPASETATNPINLQPGEPVPEVGSASVESNVKLDEESYQQADASNLGVKPQTAIEALKEVQEVYIDPFPASQTPGNPIDLQPGESIPKDQLNTKALDANVKLDEESYERADASNFGVQSSNAPVHTQTKDDGPISELTDNTEPSNDANMDGVKEVDQGVEEPEVEAPSTIGEASEETKDTEPESSPAASAVEPGLFVDKSSGEIIAPTDSESNAGIIAASVLGGVAALGGGAAIIALTSEDDSSPSGTTDNKAVKEPTGTDKKQTTDKQVDEELIIEPAPQTAPSQVHGAVIPEADVKQVIEDADTSAAPAIVVSSPPTSPTVGKQQDEDRTVEVIEPTPEIVIEGSTPKPVGRESENTPEGVRRRLAESTSLSRPVSSGNDTMSAKQQKNIMRTFWNLLLFNWLGGLGRVFGFGKKKSQRATQ